MPTRSLPVRFGWTIRDYAKRIWDNAGEDNIFFLAGGIAFNILLAVVPFVLLLLSALGYLLNKPDATASNEIWLWVDRLLPPHPETPDSPVHQILNDIIAKREAVGLYSAIGFVWFSTRLFGSLRAVLAEIFDIEQERGIVAGKIFDIKITVIATLLFVANTILSTYLEIGTTRGLAALGEIGVRKEAIGQAELYVGRAIAWAFLVMMFFSLYKFLPNRRIRWQPALLAGLWAASLFELAKVLFTAYLASFRPGSIYTGTVYVIVVVVIWVYYSAVMFILGGEIGQVYELRRVRRLQRETFEE